MQITLKQADLETAVRDFVAKMGISAELGDVNFTATRGSEGIVTDVSVGEVRSANVTRITETAAAPVKAEKEEAIAAPAKDDAVLGKDAEVEEDSADVATPKSLFS